MKRKRIDLNVYSSAIGKCFLLLAWLAAWHVTDAQVRFYATTAKQVGVNQNFQVNFVVENGQATQLKPPSFNDFQVLGGPNTSSSVQFVNGDMSQSVTYSYILRPKQQGTFKIGKANATIAGANLESNEMTITVTGPVQQQPQAQRHNPFDDFFSQDDPFEQYDEPAPTSQGDIQKQLRDNVQVRLTTDRNNVYLGEKITATLKLYFKLNINQPGITKAPSFNGFWSQEIELPKDRRPQIENLNGEQFYAVELQKFNLYPQKAGALQITPAELNMLVTVQVRPARRSFFDSFFGGQLQNVPFKPVSNALTINVRDLPANGKPEDFSGAVGKFNYEAKVSAREGKTDEPITYTVKISGAGNLKTIEPIKPELPEAFEVYEPKTNEQVQNNADGMSGSKQYDYLLIPHQPGEYRIPETAFSYFDPAAQKYVTLRAPEFSLKITGEPSANPNAGAAVAKEEVAVLGNDIRYIKTKPEPWQEAGQHFFGSAAHMGLLVSPFLLFTGLLVWRKRNQELAADVIGVKRRRALKLARKRLTAAGKLLKAQDKMGFYNEISRAFWGYLGDKLSIDPSQLSKDNAAEKLRERQVSETTIATLHGLISTSEQALYSPVGAGAAMQENYDAAMKLMADLEEEIKS
ncbi:MAG: BatD family protein [Chitinophagales bacterium]